MDVASWQVGRDRLRRVPRSEARPGRGERGAARAAGRPRFQRLQSGVRRGVDVSVQTAAPVAKTVPLVLSLAASGVFVVAGAASALAGVFARLVVTPTKEHREDLEILALVDADHGGTDVILPATEETVVPGTYSLVFDGGDSVARLGAVTSFDPADGTVQRRVEEVYSGDLRAAVRGRITGFVYPDPVSAGLDADDVQIPVEGGIAPAWLIPPPPAEGPDRPGEDVWAVMVHGRGSRRNEGIRAVPTVHRLGMTALLVSYRNDGDAPAAEDGRYGLGTTEWRDVEAAVQWAVNRGAREVVLFGWSMGAAVVLQLVDRSELAEHVTALVLDGPVVDWIEVLAHQARVNNLPEPVGRLGQWLMSNAAGRWITGLAAPVDLRAMDWVTRADQLRTRTLILHSEDDDYVPVGPSMELAERNPETVDFVRFHRADHTREWNVDPGRWDRVVRSWLHHAFSLDRPGRRRTR